jgi:hypothetical protein
MTAMRRSRLDPAVLLGAVSAACLIVFLATIPFPRVDGQLVGGDGVGYYAYLPSIVLDRDLDLANQYSALLPPGQPLLTARTPTGLSFNYWPIGPALLWLPFFLLAHGLALALTAAGAAIRLDGCGYWHQAFVLAGNIAYGGAALWLAFDVARRVARKASAMWAVVLIACAGNLTYYMTAEASLAHASSAFAVGLFFVVWLRTRGRSGLAHAATLGALVGFVAIVRTQDAVLALVPLATELSGSFRSARRQGTARAVVRTCRDGLTMAVTAVLVYSPQFLVSATLYGTWWKPPQFSVGWTTGLKVLAWSSPRFWSVLFSPESGLFVWHPIFAVALAGAVPLWFRDRRLAAALVVGVIAQTYVLGSWYDWAQGRSFGGRSFVSCLPLFAAGLAALVDATRHALAARPRARRTLLAGLAAVLVAANFLLAVEFRLDLAATDQRPTWHDLGTRRVTFVLDRLMGR